MTDGAFLPCILLIDRLNKKAHCPRKCVNDVTYFKSYVTP